jgi:predicted alpha/beta-fold hydrolase
MQRTCILAQKLGAHVYLTNHRGCGEGKGLASEPYHSGRSDDISAVIAEGRRRHPDHFHLAIGFSLSGNAVLLLAAGVRAQVLPDAVISVNAPIDLEKAALQLVSGFNRVYDRNFIGALRESVIHRMQNNMTSQKYAFPKRMTTYQFDEIYTGIEAGFGSRDNYYRTCSAAQYLPEVKIPTLVLTSTDDPFVDVSDFKAAKLSPKVQMHIEQYGGHLGYLHRGALSYGGIRWLDYFLFEQISEIISKQLSQ